MGTLKNWARRLKTETWILFQAAKDPATPWFVKAFILTVLAYALSPIDLIPDFIPLIGHLDDLLLVPAGLYLASRMVPPHVLEKHRNAYDPGLGRDATIGKIGAGLVIFAWLFFTGGLIYLGISNWGNGEVLITP